VVKANATIVKQATKADDIIIPIIKANEIKIASKNNLNPASNAINLNKLNKGSKIDNKDKITVKV
jgi:hypothetical protein